MTGLFPALSGAFLRGSKTNTSKRGVSEDIFWSVALTARAAAVQVAIPASLPGRLARYRRLRLGDPELYRFAVAAILRQGVYLLSACLLRGGGAHAVARDQGRQAASAGGRSLNVGGCLDCRMRKQIAVVRNNRSE